MASLQKTGKNYQLRFCDTTRTPAQKKFSLRVSRKKAATKLKRKLEEAYALGEFDPWTEDFRDFLFDGRRQAEPLSFTEAKKAFIQTRRDKGCTEGTVESYRGLLKLLEKPTAKAVREMIYRKDLAQATKRKRYLTTNTFFRWATKEGHIGRNPLDKIPKPKKHGKMPKSVSPEQLEAITGEMKKHYRRCRKHNWIKPREVIWRVPLFWFALYTGLRASELGRLKWEHIDFDHGLIYIYEQKNGEESTVPLTDKASRTIRTMDRVCDYVFCCPGYAESDRDIGSFVGNTSKNFRKYRRKAGLPSGLSLHGLRHGCATLLAKNGMGAVQIKTFLRHKDLSTSMKYLHLTANDVREAANNAFG